MPGPYIRAAWSAARRVLPSPKTNPKYYNSIFGRTGSSSWFTRRGFSAAAPAIDHPDSVLDPAKIRNVAVIAHVDHGKTTLMDRLLRQCGADVPHERALDSINLERERGITIASKVTSIPWNGNELNMVDTPGHADFGGEVERVVGMVEGAVLVVDAGEGPLAQTKFVVAKALKYGIRPVLMLNKVDRPSGIGEFYGMVEGAVLVVDAGEGLLAQTKFVVAKALKYGIRPVLMLNKVDQPSVSEDRCGEVESMVFDLFANLGASEEQLEFPILYASAKEGWASTTFTKDPPTEHRNMSALLDAILSHVPPPKANLEEPFKMMVSMMERDFYLGRILTGRITSGIVRIGDKVHGLRKTASGSEKTEEGRVVKLMKKKGMSTALIDCAGAGDIISLAGLSNPSIGHTVSSVEVTTALPAIELDPPTISMTFSVNDSSLGGRDGTQLTGAKIGERLRAEAETNLAINVVPIPGTDSFEVQGRGEMQLGILIENMRREGFELSVSPPKVMYKTDDGQKLEPLEEVIIEVNEEHVGLVMEALSNRRGELIDMGPCAGAEGRSRMTLTCPSRGLVGYRSVFNADTHGTGFMHRAFLTYAKYRGPLGNVRKGVLVSMGSGTITAYSLMGLEARGILFVSPGMEAYDGMIIGEHSRDSDLDVNPVRAKELSNMRSANKDENVRLAPPRQMTLEEAIGYVAADELIEVTPKTVRLRKKCLDVNKRKSIRRFNKE